MRFEDIDFLIIGAGKSATTWLQTQLQADPSVYMPDPELHYFSRRFDKGDAWYLAQFAQGARGRLVGDKSNSYLYTPRSAERIHRVLPHVKLIAQLRNPVKRAYSHYCMLFRRGDVGPDIARHLHPARGGEQRLVRAGDYAGHLQEYIDLFGRDKLLILFFEGVRADPEQQMTLVREHLSLPPRPLATHAGKKVKDRSAPAVPASIGRRLAWMKPLVQPLRGNAVFELARGSIARHTPYPPLTDDIRARLEDYYHPSIQALELMSGQSLDHWYGAGTLAPVTSGEQRQSLTG